MKKVIIVDDEDPARSLVKEYLSAYEDFILIQECNNGVDAVKAINSFKPDLVFMDIQMPGLTGFEVLKKLDHMPKIIFSTAYDKYALQAFEVHAIDYLLKPYTQERFASAMRQMINSANDYIGQMQDLLSSLNEKETYLTTMLVQTSGKLINISTADILWIEADGDYAKLILRDRYYLSSQGVTKLEKRLDPKTFTRVHRSAIINLNAVREVYKYPSGYDVVMINGDKVKVSRSYLDKIRKWMV